MERLWKNKGVNVWIAIVAILMNTLMPSVARAFIKNDANVPYWGVICSSSNSLHSSKKIYSNKNLFLKTPKKIDGKIIKHLVKHCALCISTADQTSLPPNTVNFPALTVQEDGFNTFHYQAPFLQSTWNAIPPRGPPYFI
jgi:hypothetical protein